MMGKLAVIFVALFVASIAARPSNLLANLKSLQQVKRAATLLKPLHLMSEQKKSESEINALLEVLDTDHDGMLDPNELKVMVEMAGASPDDVVMFIEFVMGFDKDLNQKLDINELKEVDKILG